MDYPMDYSKMSLKKLERLAPGDPEAAWELYKRILNQGYPPLQLQEEEDTDNSPLRWGDTQPMPPLIPLDD